MPLFETTPVDVGAVKTLVKKHWNVELGENIKASQNQTFQASMINDSGNQPVIVRVTPNPGGKRSTTIDLELNILQFLSKNALPVCEAFPDLESGALSVSLGELSVSVFHYAQGEAVNFLEWKWMTNETIVSGVGRFMGRLHQLLDEFEDEHPELSATARNWRELHDGTLKDVKVHPNDENQVLTSAASKPRAYGLVHGDINPSNYYWYSEVQMPSMFDWDQLQRSWRLYDLSSCIWTVVMLQGAGSPVDMSPVPQANVSQYTDWLVKGYEQEIGHSIDRDSLQRMVEIRRHLYANFCSRALAELSPGTFMYNFCKFIDDWLSGKNKDAK